MEPEGIHVGGFGWVEDLRPGSHDESLGYIHAPSLAHAATAAILRSGHLGHVSTEGNPLAIDLTSERVKHALVLLDGVRQGQPIGVLLGYRFERSLRERDVQLARYILPFRIVAPIAPESQEEGAPRALESIAARDVVDGVTLLEKWRHGEPALMDSADVADADRAAVSQVLADLDGQLDAVSDLLVAESVFQTVTGNLDRAGAAAAALDRQRPPPEPDVVRTPRTGRDHVYRCVLLFSSVDLPASWSAVPTDHRAAAEPNLNAWIAHLLGDPARMRCAAEVLDEDGNVVEVVEARLTDLGLSPISVVALAGSGGTERPTELEERFALVLSGSVTHTEQAAELRLLSDRREEWPASAVSLGELLAMVESARSLIAGARPINAADLSLPEDSLSPGIDLDELLERGAVLVAAVDTVVGDLASALDSSGTSADEFRSLLASAAEVGAKESVPVSLDSDTDSVSALRNQADVVARVLSSALEQARQSMDQIGAGTAVDVAAEAVIAAIRAILGADFPVLPRFVLAEAGECAASIADQAALTGGNALRTTMWLQRRALVRPRVGQLSETLMYGELSGSGLGPTDLTIIQLPHAPGDRWVAADLGPERIHPVGRISIVAHSPVVPNVKGPLSGLMIDDWMETIPSQVETTGVAFHYDAPGTRAPQVVVLAVPSDPDAADWSFEMLRDTVVETIELTKIRAVDPQQIWLAGRVLPALYVAHNVAGDTSSVNLFDFEAQLGTKFQGG